MDVSFLIRHKLHELNLGQKDLAAAAQVTESYISQLLARKKPPPAPARTDIYDKIGRLLGLPAGELSVLAETQRREELKKKVAEPPRPMLKECRELILAKCETHQRAEIRRIFELQAFGELERLVTQKILDVTQTLAREELRSDDWLRSLAEHSNRSFEQMRVATLEFLDTDVLQISVEDCELFLSPMVDSWEIDLKTFSLEIVLNPRLFPAGRKRFEFLESKLRSDAAIEPGLERFLNNPALSGDATEKEILFLRSIQFDNRRPTPLYYYRELQSLRDPLHFSTPEQSGTSELGDLLNKSSDA